MENEHFNMFSLENNQIVIFQAWYQDASWNNFAFKGVEVMDNITDKKWYYFYNIHIGYKTHNLP